MKKRILFIEDEAAIRQMIRLTLERDGYAVTEAEDGKSGLNAIAQQMPDLILIDWMLPDISGPEIIKRLRNEAPSRNIPIIMLTARHEEDDMVHGLEVGADDYLAKPVSLKNLRVRIKALLRRFEGHTSTENSVLSVACMTLDLHSHDLTMGSETINLAITEFRLLAFLMQHPLRVFSRLQLLDSVWGQNTFIEERTVDVHIMRLRKILKQYSVDKCIQTVRGAGYRFSEDGCIGE